MGVSIKTDRVEALLRAFAARRGPSLTRTLETELEIAMREEDAAALRNPKTDALWKEFMEAVRTSTFRSDRDRTREELQER